MADTVLVTGGTGYVGGWTIVELLKRGHRVRATVRSLGKEAALRQAIASQVDAGSRLEVVAADLDADAGWPEAMAGCRYVLHIASPLGAASGASLVQTAVDGTLRVLQAAVDAGVSRVVLTSSTAACTPGEAIPRAIDEDDWTNPDEPGLSDYRRSKVIAERAAWDLMAGKTTELVTLLPGAIFGPVLTPDQEGSVGFIRRLLQGQPPALPRLGFNITDVRDLANLHIRAMDAPGAAGQRFIVMGDALWYGEIAHVLRERLGDKAAKVPTAKMPDMAFRALAAVNGQMKALLPLLGRTQAFSTQKARSILGYAPRAVADTVADCGATIAA